MSLAGFDCGGLQFFSVDDLTGEVEVLSQTTTANSHVSPPSDPLTPRLAQLNNDTDLGLYIEEFLTVSDGPNLECINLATLSTKVIRGPTLGGSLWRVRAGNDSDAQITLGCPRIHYYEVNTWNGDVRRIR